MNPAASPFVVSGQLFVTFERQVDLRDCSTKTSWAACLDNQGTLESTVGSVFLRVSIALCPAVLSGIRALIGFHPVGSQGISEAEHSADQRPNAEQYNVRRLPTLPRIHVLPCLETRTLLMRYVGTYRTWLHANVPWRKLEQPPPKPQLGSNLSIVSLSTPLLLPDVMAAWLTLWFRI